ncbi:hypothetical protein ONS96_009944 [Cadophora gregata f. sp. sojae]|nr:hypothetical protein ONS96_009944 [Cadophora gregata f. sp. sojae]
MKSLFLLMSTIGAASATFFSEPTKDRYTEKDGLAAAEVLWKNATFDNGLNMTTNDCVYKHVNTTIVSLCNGGHRNRTVYKDEVKRGIEQLMKDCGGGGSFNGVHIVNNLTFAAFGIFAVTTDNDCQVFCEQSRTGFLGIEQPADGEWGDGQPPGLANDLNTANEASVSNGISVGVEGILKEVFGAGVSYQWSTTITKVKGLQRTAEASQVFYGRWVVFPKFIQSCGKVTKRTYVRDPVVPCGPGCIPVTK